MTHDRAAKEGEGMRLYHKGVADAVEIIRAYKTRRTELLYKTADDLLEVIAADIEAHSDSAQAYAVLGPSATQPPQELEGLREAIDKATDEIAGIFSPYGGTYWDTKQKIRAIVERAALTRGEVGTQPLLHEPSKHSPECHCPPNECQAPRIMGRQMPCRREARRASQETK